LGAFGNHVKNHNPNKEACLQGPRGVERKDKSREFSGGTHKEEKRRGMERGGRGGGGRGRKGVGEGGGEVAGGGMGGGGKRGEEGGEGKEGGGEGER